MLIVQCHGWQTKHWPIKYKFYQSPKKGTVLSIQSEGINPLNNFLPTIGDESNGFLNTITVLVMNRYRQFHEILLHAYVSNLFAACSEPSKCNGGV